MKNLIGLTFAKTLSNTALIKYESIMNAIKHTINNITSDQIIPDELIPFPTLVATKVKTAYGVSSITQSRILKMISLSASTKFLNGFTFSSLSCATNTYATATRIAVKIIGIVFSSAISDITFLGKKFMKISENDVTLLWNVVVSSPSIERYAFLPTPKTSPKPSANIMAKNVVVISHPIERKPIPLSCFVFSSEVILLIIATIINGLTNALKTLTYAFPIGVIHDVCPWNINPIATPAASATITNNVKSNFLLSLNIAKNKTKTTTNAAIAVKSKFIFFLLVLYRCHLPFTPVSLSFCIRFFLFVLIFHSLLY